jgi:hypothetical protein
MLTRFVSAGAVLALAICGAHADENQPSPGAVEQQSGAVSQNVKLPALHLTNPQREQVRKAALTKHNDVEIPACGDEIGKGFCAERRRDAAARSRSGRLSEFGHRPIAAAARLRLFEN